MRPIKIVAVSGSGRTGSTLLSLMLSQHQEVFNLGQLRDFWAAYLKAKPCSCDHDLPDCPIYSQVVRQVFGEAPEAGLKQLRNRMEIFFSDANRIADWSASDALTALRADHAEFLEVLGAVLQALRQVTGASQFIDTSKSPEFALALSLLPQVDLWLLNLARDPRAVACSWHRKKGLKAAARFSRLWASRQSILVKWSRLLGERYLQIRYEDFARRPDPIIREIAVWASIKIGEGLFVTPDQVRVSWAAQHLYPPANEGVLNARKTDIQIRPSDGWRAPKNLHVHLFALLFSYPLGLRYVREGGRF